MEEKCGGGDGGGVGGGRENQPPRPPLLPTGSDEREPQRWGILALSSLEKKEKKKKERPFVGTAGDAGGFWMCGCERGFFFFFFVQSHNNFQRCLVCTSLKKLQESAARLSRGASCQNTAGVAELFEAGERRSSPFVRICGLIPGSGATDVCSALALFTPGYIYTQQHTHTHRGV